MEKYKKRKRFIINSVYFLIVGGIALGMCRYILPSLPPFFLAFLVASLIQIPVKKIGGSQAKRKTLAFLFSSLFYALLFVVVAMVGIKLFNVTGNIIVSVPLFYNETVVPLLGEIAERLEEAMVPIDITISQKVEQIFDGLLRDIGQYVTDFSVKTVKALSGGATKIPGLVVKLVVTVVSTFFIASDFDKIINFFKRFVPKGKEQEIVKTLGYVKNIIFIYLKSYSFLFLLTFVELLIGFFVLGIPYAAILALAIAVFDILPVLGTGGILLPWALVLLLIKNIPLAVGMLVLYVVVTAIRNTVEPRIVGKQIGLHPLATLVFMFIGLKVLGIIGMVVFPVVLSILVSLEKNGVIHIWKSPDGIERGQRGGE